MDVVRLSLSIDSGIGSMIIVIRTPRFPYRVSGLTTVIRGRIRPLLRKGAVAALDLPRSSSMILGIREPGKVYNSMRYRLVTALVRRASPGSSAG